MIIRRLLGGAYGLLLSTEEYFALFETVESYCLGITGPTTTTEEYGPLPTPRAEKFWQLHAEMATKAERGATESSPSHSGN